MLDEEVEDDLLEFLESKGKVVVKFGYLVFERMNNSSWKATSYDYNGNELFSTQIDQ